jgi:DNA-binding PadR family transcriptional regulator
VAKRHDVLEFAVLGVLTDGPLHGYELRKRLATVLGPFRALSYGSLYPCLRRLQGRGLIDEVDVTPATESAAPPLAARRARVVYAVTGEGKEEFGAWANQPGPEAWEDEGFAAHLAFFGRTEARVRLRILEGRRSRLEERVDSLRESLARSRERVDAYTLQLQQHGLDGAEREVRWLNELIQNERDSGDAAATGTSTADASPAGEASDHNEASINNEEQ